MLYDSSEEKNNVCEPSFAYNEIIDEINTTDILENTIREQMPEILNILLFDRTLSTTKTKKNIIWANENYISQGLKMYAATAQIQPELVTGKNGHLIMPRALKTRELQKERTKSKAEVFTPIWVVKQQNDVVERDYLDDDLETYVKRTWLEITCGEAPYMATRYDMETGELVPINERVGFVDRKLARINAEVSDKAEWQRLVELAYQASYGFEWNGDSLLIARENLLYTYRDYYFEKWQEEPLYGLFEKVAEIISYNIFQMDGIAKKYGKPKKSSGSYYIVPLSESKETRLEVQMSFDLRFDDDSEESKEEPFIIIPGKRVKIMNWEINKMEYFDKGAK
ncbi:restriction endonuclease [Bacillus cereus group sp. MYBK14-1]|uniref:restriction endonuclease n=1 Tax=Bacillus cereus group sp. MYBK14-1 TaxID=3450682 RepID=UPI003F7A42DA